MSGDGHAGGGKDVPPKKPENRGSKKGKSDAAPHSAKAEGKHSDGKGGHPANGGHSDAKAGSSAKVVHETKPGHSANSRLESAGQKPKGGHPSEKPQTGHPSGKVESTGLFGVIKKSVENKVESVRKELSHDLEKVEKSASANLFGAKALLKHPEGQQEKKNSDHPPHSESAKQASKFDITSFISKAKSTIETEVHKDLQKILHPDGPPGLSAEQRVKQKVTHYEDPHTHVKYDYDKRGREIETHRPDGTTSRTEYKGAGVEPAKYLNFDEKHRITDVTTDKGHHTHLEYDPKSASTEPTSFKVVSLHTGQTEWIGFASANSKIHVDSKTGDVKVKTEVPEEGRTQEIEDQFSTDGSRVTIVSEHGHRLAKQKFVPGESETKPKLVEATAYNYYDNNGKPVEVKNFDADTKCMAVQTDDLGRTRHRYEFASVDKADHGQADRRTDISYSVQENPKTHSKENVVNREVHDLTHGDNLQMTREDRTDTTTGNTSSDSKFFHNGKVFQEERTEKTINNATRETSVHSSITQNGQLVQERLALYSDDGKPISLTSQEGNHKYDYQFDDKGKVKLEDGHPVILIDGKRMSTTGLTEAQQKEMEGNLLNRAGEASLFMARTTFQNDVKVYDPREHMQEIGPTNPPPVREGTKSTGTLVCYYGAENRLSQFRVDHGKVTDNSGVEIGTMNDNGTVTLNGKSFNILDASSEGAAFHGVGSDRQRLDLVDKKDLEKSNYNGVLSSVDGTNRTVIGNNVYNQHGDFLAHLNTDGTVQLKDKPKGETTDVCSAFRDCTFVGKDNGNVRTFTADAHASNGHMFRPDPKTGQPVKYDIVMGMIIRSQPWTDEKGVEHPGGEQYGNLMLSSRDSKLQEGTIRSGNPPKDEPLENFKNTVLDVHMAGREDSGGPGHERERNLQVVCLGPQDRDANGNIIGGGNGYFDLAAAAETENKNFKPTSPEDRDAQLVAINHIIATGRTDDVSGQIGLHLSQGEGAQLTGDPILLLKKQLNDMPNRLEELPKGADKVATTHGYVIVQLDGGKTQRVQIENGQFMSPDGKTPAGQLHGGDGSMSFMDPTTHHLREMQMRDLRGAVWHLEYTDDNNQQQKVDWIGLGTDKGMISVEDYKRRAREEVTLANCLNDGPYKSTTTQANLDETRDREQSFNAKLDAITKNGITDAKDLDFLSVGPKENVRAKQTLDLDKEQQPQKVTIEKPPITSQNAHTVEGRVRIGNDSFKSIDGQLHKITGPGADDYVKEPAAQLGPGYQVYFRDGRTIDLTKEPRVLMEFTIDGAASEHRLVGLGPGRITNQGEHMEGGLVEADQLLKQAGEDRQRARDGDLEYFKQRTTLMGDVWDSAMGSRAEILQHIEHNIGQSEVNLHKELNNAFSDGFDPAKFDNNRLDGYSRVTQRLMTDIGATSGDSQNLAQEGVRLQHQANEAAVMAVMTVATAGVGTAFTALGSGADALIAGRFAENAVQLARMTKVAQVSLYAGELTTDALAGGVISREMRSTDGSTEAEKKRLFLSGTFEGGAMGFGSVGGKIFKPLLEGEGAVKALVQAGNSTRTASIYVNSARATWKTFDAFAQTAAFSVSGQMRELKGDETGLGAVQAAWKNVSTQELVVGTMAMGVGQFVHGKVSEGAANLFGKDSFGARAIGDMTMGYTNSAVSALPDVIKQQTDEIAAKYGLRPQDVTAQMVLANGDFNFMRAALSMNESGVEGSFSAGLIAAGSHHAMKMFEHSVSGGRQPEVKTDFLGNVQTIRVADGRTQLGERSFKYENGTGNQFINEMTMTGKDPTGARTRYTSSDGETYNIQHFDNNGNLIGSESFKGTVKVGKLRRGTETIEGVVTISDTNGTRHELPNGITIQTRTSGKGEEVWSQNGQVIKISSPPHNTEQAHIFGKDSIDTPNGHLLKMEKGPLKGKWTEMVDGDRKEVPVSRVQELLAKSLAVAPESFRQLTPDGPREAISRDGMVARLSPDGSIEIFTSRADLERSQLQGRLESLKQKANHLEADVKSGRLAPEGLVELAKTKQTIDDLRSSLSPVEYAQEKYKEAQMQLQKHPGEASEFAFKSASADLEVAHLKERNNVVLGEQMKANDKNVAIAEAHLQEALKKNATPMAVAHYEVDLSFARIKASTDKQIISLKNEVAAEQAKAKLGFGDETTIAKTLERLHRAELEANHRLTNVQTAEKRVVQNEFEKGNRTIVEAEERITQLKAKLNKPNINSEQRTALEHDIARANDELTQTRAAVAADVRRVRGGLVEARAEAQGPAQNPAVAPGEGLSEIKTPQEPFGLSGHPDSGTEARTANGAIETRDAKGHLTVTGVEEQHEFEQFRGRVRDLCVGNPAMQARLETTLDAFKERAYTDPAINRAELPLVLHHLSRLMAENPNSAIPLSERMNLAQELLSQVAYPESVDQGNNPTCNVTTEQARLCKRTPSDVVQIVSELALYGKCTSADGQIVMAQHFGDLSGLVMDDNAQMKRVQDLVQPAPDAERHDWGARSHASQLVQKYLVNLKWERAGVREDGTAFPAGTYHYDGVFVRDTATGRPIHWMHGKPLETPYVFGSDLEKIHERATGRHESFVMVNVDTYPGEGPKTNPRYQFASADSMYKVLQNLKEDGKLPSIIQLNTFHEPFWSDSGFGGAGGSGGEHVVGIHGFEIVIDPTDKRPMREQLEHPNPENVLVAVDNQWGKDADHIIKKIPLSELYRSTRKPSDVQNVRELEAELARHPDNLKTQLELIRYKHAVYQERQNQAVLRNSPNASISVSAERYLQSTEHAGIDAAQMQLEAQRIRHAAWHDGDGAAKQQKPGAGKIDRSIDGAKPANEETTGVGTFSAKELDHLTTVDARDRIKIRTMAGVLEQLAINERETTRKHLQQSTEPNAERQRLIDSASKRLPAPLADLVVKAVEKFDRELAAVGVYQGDINYQKAAKALKQVGDSIEGLVPEGMSYKRPEGSLDGTVGLVQDGSKWTEGQKDFAENRVREIQQVLEKVSQDIQGVKTTDAVRETQAVEQFREAARSACSNDPVMQARMEGTMEAFRERVYMDANIDHKEIARVMDHVCALLENRADTAIPMAERRHLALELLNQVAYPEGIDQGKHQTCNVTTEQARLSMRTPSEVARIIREIALTGECKTADGKVIRTEHAGDVTGLNMDKDAQIKRAQDTEEPGENQIGLRRDKGARSHCSQLIQKFLVNVKWELTTADTLGRRVPEGTYHYDGFCVRDTRTGVALTREDDGRPQETANLTGGDLETIHERLTGRKESFVMLNKDTYYHDVPGTNKRYHFENTDEMFQVLRNLKDDKNFPSILQLHTFHEPFWHDSGFEGSGGEHVVSIRGFDVVVDPTDKRPVSEQLLHPKPENVLVSVVNQWGKDADHVLHKIPLSQLSRATRPVDDIHNVREVEAELVARPHDLHLQLELARYKHEVYKKRVEAESNLQSQDHYAVEDAQKYLSESSPHDALSAKQLQAEARRLRIAAGGSTTRKIVDDVKNWGRANIKKIFNKETSEVGSLTLKGPAGETTAARDRAQVREMARYLELVAEADAKHEVGTTPGSRLHERETPGAGRKDTLSESERVGAPQRDTDKAAPAQSTFDQGIQFKYSQDTISNAEFTARHGKANEPLHVVHADGSPVASRSEGGKEIYDLAPGKKVVHDRVDGSIEYREQIKGQDRVSLVWANLSHETESMKTSIKHLDFLDRGAFAKDLNNFVRRAKADKLPEHEIALALHEIRSLIDYDGTGAIENQSLRKLLARQAMHQSAHPEAVEQGQNNTCPLLVCENLIYRTAPAQAIRLLKDVATKGAYICADGTKIDMKSFAGALDPDAEATKTGAWGLPHKIHLNLKNNRTYASQLFQLTIANAHWAKAFEGDYGERAKVAYKNDIQAQVREEVDAQRAREGKPPVGVLQVRYELVANKNGERLGVYEMVDGRPVERVHELRDQQKNAVENPAISGSFIQDMFNQVTGREATGHMLAYVAPGKGDHPMQEARDWKNVQGFSRPEDLNNILKESGPIAIVVHNTREPFKTDAISGESSHWVVVRHYDPQTRMATIENQYGEFKVRKMSLETLYEATTGPADGGTKKAMTWRERLQLLQKYSVERVRKQSVSETAKMMRVVDSKGESAVAMARDKGIEPVTTVPPSEPNREYISEHQVDDQVEKLQPPAAAVGDSPARARTELENNALETETAMLRHVVEKYLQGSNETLPTDMTREQYQKLNQELEREHAQLDHLARTDAMTGLPNRKGLTDALSKEISMFERNKDKIAPPAVVFMDFDGFKPVNDNLGHPRGDDLIKFFGKWLKENFRNTDVAGRFGGDEFVAVLRNAKDVQVVKDKLEHLRIAIAQTGEPRVLGADEKLQAGEYEVGISSGIAKFQAKDSSAANEDKVADMLHAADKEMYLDKKVRTGKVQEIEKKQPDVKIEVNPEEEAEKQRSLSFTKRLGPSLEYTTANHTVEQLREIVTRNRSRNMEIVRNLIRDPLTGLVNKGEVEARLTRCVNDCNRESVEATKNGADQPKLTVLSIDLDGLKRINDIFGHAAGDTLIKAATKFMKAHGLRDSDTLARLGGDEFLALMPGCKDASRTLEAFRNYQLACSIDEKGFFKIRPLEPNEKLRTGEVRSGISVGAVDWEPGRNAEDLKKLSDDELYVDKKHREALGLREPRAVAEAKTAETQSKSQKADTDVTQQSKPENLFQSRNRTGSAVDGADSDENGHGKDPFDHMGNVLSGLSHASDGDYENEKINYVAGGSVQAHLELQEPGHSDQTESGTAHGTSREFQEHLKDFLDNHLVPEEIRNRVNGMKPEEQVRFLTHRPEQINWEAYYNEHHLREALRQQRLFPARSNDSVVHLQDQINNKFPGDWHFPDLGTLSDRGLHNLLAHRLNDFKNHAFNDVRNMEQFHALLSPITPGWEPEVNARMQTLSKELAPLENTETQVRQQLMQVRERVDKEPSPELEKEKKVLQDKLDGLSVQIKVRREELNPHIQERLRAIQDSVNAFAKGVGLPEVKVQVLDMPDTANAVYRLGTGTIGLREMALCDPKQVDVGVLYHELLHSEQDAAMMRNAALEAWRSSAEKVPLKEFLTDGREQVEQLYAGAMGAPAWALDIEKERYTAIFQDEKQLAWISERGHLNREELERDPEFLRAKNLGESLKPKTTPDAQEEQVMLLSRLQRSVSSNELPEGMVGELLKYPEMIKDMLDCKPAFHLKPHEFLALLESPVFQKRVFGYELLSAAYGRDSEVKTASHLRDESFENMLVSKRGFAASVLKYSVEQWGKALPQEDVPRASKTKIRMMVKALKHYAGELARDGQSPDTPDMKQVLKKILKEAEVDARNGAARRVWKDYLNNNFELEANLAGDRLNNLFPPGQLKEPLTEPSQESLQTPSQEHSSTPLAPETSERSETAKPAAPEVSPAPKAPQEFLSLRQPEMGFTDASFDRFLKDAKTPTLNSIAYLSKQYEQLHSATNAEEQKTLQMRFDRNLNQTLKMLDLMSKNKERSPASEAKQRDASLLRETAAPLMVKLVRDGLRELEEVKRIDTENLSLKIDKTYKRIEILEKHICPQLEALSTIPVKSIAQATTLRELDERVNEQIATFRSDYAALSKRVAAGTLSPQLTGVHEGIGNFLTNRATERLAHRYGWDEHQVGSFDKSDVQMNDGFGAQRRVFSALAKLLNDGELCTDEIRKQMANAGVSPDNLIGIGMKANSPADGVGADYLLADYTTGDFHPIDLTIKTDASYRHEKLVESKLTNPELTWSPDKKAPSERQKWLLCTSDDANWENQVKAHMKADGVPLSEWNNRFVSYDTVQTFDKLKEALVQQIVAFAKHGGLNMFDLPLPSNNPASPVSRQLYEMWIFRRRLEQKGMREWARAVDGAMGYLRKTKCNDSEQTMWNDQTFRS